MNKLVIANIITKHLRLHDLQVIDVHTGECICVVVKHIGTHKIENVMKVLPNVTVQNICTSIEEQYHYIMVNIP